MIVTADYAGNRVRILEVFTDNGRRRAKAEALAGEPFQKYTSGGWCSYCQTTASVDLLTNVRVEAPTLDEEIAGLREHINNLAELSELRLNAGYYDRYPRQQMQDQTELARLTAELGTLETLAESQPIPIEIPVEV